MIPMTQMRPLMAAGKPRASGDDPLLDAEARLIDA